MPIVEKITALLDALDAAELDRMHPADRRRFVELCHHWAQLADKRDRQQEPKSDILAELERGERAHD
jgi:hypothetical protein